MSSTVSKSISNALFKIGRNTTIQSDNKPHRVTVTHADFSVEFEYIAIPSLIQNAYLKAIATNTSEYPLLEGKMHIFMDGVFVATASVKQTSPGEELELYLGIDINIKIENLPSTEESSTSGGLFKRFKNQDCSRSVDIHNNRDVDIKIILWDLLPKSTDERVKIKMTSPDESEDRTFIKTDKFHIKRDLFIKARKKERVTFAYTIEYPENKYISIQKQF